MTKNIVKTVGAMIVAKPSKEAYNEVANALAKAYYNKLLDGSFTIYRENKYNTNTPDNSEYPTFILLQLVPGDKDWSGEDIHKVTREFMYSNMSDYELSKHFIDAIIELDSKSENLFKDVTIVRGLVPEGEKDEELLSKVDSVMNAKEIRATIGLLLDDDVDGFLDAYNNDDSSRARHLLEGDVDKFVYIKGGK